MAKFNVHENQLNLAKVHSEIIVTIVTTISGTFKNGLSMTNKKNWVFIDLLRITKHYSMKIHNMDHNLYMIFDFLQRVTVC